MKVSSMGGYFGGESSQETPDMQTALFEYADGAILEFGTRGEHTNDEGSVRIGNIFYGTKGWLWIEESRRKWQSYSGPEEREGAGRRMLPRRRRERTDGLTTIEFPHYQNFVDAIRANDPKILTCDILEGHLSSTLPHLANISYLVGPRADVRRQDRNVRGRQEGRRLLTQGISQGVRRSRARSRAGPTTRRAGKPMFDPDQRVVTIETPQPAG